MKRSSVNEYIECDYVRIRQDNGSLLEIPIVNNKGIFRHFFKTEEQFRYQVISNLENIATFALYEKIDNFSCLICAFSKAEEINDRAKEILKVHAPFVLESLEVKDEED